MKMTDCSTAEEARNKAIDWQDWAVTQDLSYGEMIDWHAYFEKLAEKFPELKDEFKENCII